MELTTFGIAIAERISTIAIATTNSTTVKPLLRFALLAAISVSLCLYADFAPQGDSLYIAMGAGRQITEVILRFTRNGRSDMDVGMCAFLPPTTFLRQPKEIRAKCSLT